jgi:hypothetical protein
VQLLRRGRGVIPALLEAMERRDVELRRQAHGVLQRMINGSAVFDPYAPEALRREQIARLREGLERGDF